MRSNLFNKLLVLIAIISLSFASTHAYDFRFFIEVDHNFDNNQEINCEVEYDGLTRSWSFDDDSDSEDYEYEKEFDEYVNLDCDTDIDEIFLEVFDIALDKKIHENKFNDVEGFEYELEELDKDENWFELEIKHSFGSSEEIDCDLTIDLKEISYEFNSDSDDEDLLIRKNFNDEFKMDCEDEIDEMTLTVYDDDEDIIFEKVYDNRDFFDYEISDSDESIEVKIEIDNNFGSDEIICTLELDNDEENFEFDSDSSSSDLNFIREFSEEVIFDCSDDIDDIYVTIYDDAGDRIDSLHFENEDGFEYEYTNGDLEAFMQITHEFPNRDDEIECEFSPDDTSNAIDYEFSDYSSISELRIEEEFDKKFVFDCDDNLEKIELMIFDSDNSKDEILYKKTFTNVDKIDYVHGSEDKIDEPEEQEEPSVNEEPQEEIIVEEPNEVNESNITKEVGSDVQSGNVNEDNTAINSSTEEIIPKENKEMIGEINQKSNAKLFFIILLSVLVIVGLFTLFLGKLSGKSPGVKENYHSRRIQKDKVDFSFLDKKKRR